MSRSYTASTICISLLLLLLGVVGYFVLGARRVSAEISSNMTVSVFLASDVSTEQKAMIEREIAADKDVLSYTFLSSQQATADFEKSTGIVVGRILDENPIPSSYELRPRASEVVPEIEKRAASWSGVVSTLYPKDVSSALMAKIAVVNKIILGIAALLLVVALSLIYYTLKLSIMANAEAIRTMLLVGARRGFIKKPYIRRAVIQGFVASLFAGGLLVLVTEVFAGVEPVVTPEIDWAEMSMIISAIMATGVLINTIFTAVVINRMVK